MSSIRSCNNKHLLIKKLELPKDNFEAYFPNINRLQMKPPVSIRENQRRRGNIISLSSLSTREESLKKSLSPIASRASSIFNRDDSSKSQNCQDIQQNIAKSSRILKRNKKIRKKDLRKPILVDGVPIKRKKSAFLIIRGNDVKSVERLINITKFYQDFHEKSKNLLTLFSKSINHENEL